MSGMTPGGGSGSRRPAPLSLRLSPEERRRLEKQAAGVSLSAYVKERLFGADAPARRTRGKAPVKDHELLGKLLAQLGASRLPQNMNQLAKAAHLGTLPVSVETERELRRACQDIEAMRWVLMKGLGMRTPDKSPPRETVTQSFTRAGYEPWAPNDLPEPKP